MLILDLFHPFPPRLLPDPRYAAEVEDFPETALPAGFHRDRQYNEVEIIYYVTHPDGHQERLVESFPFRYFFRYEVEHLLSLSGFRVVDIFGDFDRSPFSADSPEMIFVAEKAGTPVHLP